MADLITKTRTNYFRSVNDVALHELICAMKTDGPPVIFSRVNDKCMFCCNGEIEGVMTTEAKLKLETDPNWADDHPEEAYSLDLMLDRLKSLIAPGDACVIKTISHEAIRDVWADAYVVTRDGVKYISLDNIAQTMVRNILGDKNWRLNTTC